MSFSFDINFDTAMTISRTAVVSIGILGNIISFIVFSRKTFRNNSISTYCRALAVLDCFTIIQLIRDVYSYFNITAFFDLSDATCKIFYYFSMQYTGIPGWILVAFSVDKTFNMKVSSPRILKSKLFQWSVVAAIVIFNLLFFIELLISLEVEPFIFIPSIQFCNFPFLSYLNVFIYVLIAQSCAIPFGIMIVSSIITIRLLWKSRGSIERIGHVEKKRRSRDIKFAISSVTFNVLFIVFKTPFLIYYLLPFEFQNYYFYQVEFLLFLINSSGNFFIHLATNSVFRRELLTILRINPAGNKVSTIASSNPLAQSHRILATVQE
jgi:hypothetical protein